MHICMYVRVCECAYIYIYTHKYARAHTHVHTHTHRYFQYLAGNAYLTLGYHEQAQRHYARASDLNTNFSSADREAGIAATGDFFIFLFEH